MKCFDRGHFGHAAFQLILLVACGLALGSCGSSSSSATAEPPSVAQPPRATTGVSATTPEQLASEFKTAKRGLANGGYTLDNSVELHNAEGLRDVVAFDGVTGFQFTVAQFDTPANGAAFLARTNAAMKDSGYVLAGRPTSQIGGLIFFGYNSDVLNGDAAPDPTAVTELKRIQRLATTGE